MITVIGAGVTGLSVATELIDAGYDVTMVAEFWPGDEDVNYTSPWAGAHFRPTPPTSPVQEREQAWNRVSYAVMKKMAKLPGSGVDMIKGRDYLEAPDAHYKKGEFAADCDNFRLLQASELPRGVTWGCEYTTWCLNSPVYCAFLLRRLRIKGVKTIKQRLANPLEAFRIRGHGKNIVVNCTGFGFGDPNVFVTRGQTVVVSNSFDHTVTRVNKDGSWRYIIPRPLDGGTVVGGVKEADDWTFHPREETRAAILRDVEQYGLTNPKVIRDIVGRRPTRRGGARVEVESSPLGKVVHAYGVGGMGYEVSWGVARNVAELVAPLMSSL